MRYLHILTALLHFCKRLLINFELNDCNTQRNLNYEGIYQSKKIGQFFFKNEIKIDRVLSSEWCRCKDTAALAFNQYTTFNALNSFYGPKFKDNKDKQIRELKNYIINWNIFWKIFHLRFKKILYYPILKRVK